MWTLQASTTLEKRRRHMWLSVSFAKFFRNTFIMETLLRTGFERTILWKTANRHTYYNKEISWSRQLFQKTDTARESIYLRTIDRKLTLNLIVVFKSFTDISFLKYVTKIFCVSYYFQEKVWHCFKVKLSIAVFVYILSSKGASQLQVLYKGSTLFSEENFQLKLRSSNVFPTILILEIAELLGQNLKSSLWKIMS